jgi:hypothetical protein
MNAALRNLLEKVFNMLKPTPINSAEAIFEPFWDPQLSGLPHWKIDPGEAHGLRVSQAWCWAGFEWARRPQEGPALRMSRRFGLDCGGYDLLMLSASLPAGAVLRLSAATDRGALFFEAPPSPGAKKEHFIPLSGAACIEEIALEVWTDREGIAAGWFNWLGLQNSARLPLYLEQYARFDPAWEGYLQPESYAPRFEPRFGLLIAGEELESFRQAHQAQLDRQGATPYMQAAEAAARLAPEAMIGEFVNFWTDTRYCRERDHGHLLLTHGPAAAVAGLLLRDPQLLRLGARYALALAACDHWDDGMICRFPGSTFDHRCFVQSLCTYEIALLLDLAGELFTGLGREFLLRRLGEEGLGSIQRVIWTHEYIFECNQLAWFTPGRMLGALTLERAWRRAGTYAELACADLIESLEATILPDGGYVEGPTYFRCVARDGGLALYHYARARNRDFRSVVPPALARTAAFGAALASTDESADVIPICDGSPRLEIEALAVMAALLPESAWVRMYHKAVSRQGGFPGTVLAWQMSRQVPAAGQDLPAFLALPEMGPVASARKLGPEWVKILLQGNRAGAGHAHEDKGSFVLEFAGDTFALDPGTCDYSSPVSNLVKHCERHNMLVPAGTFERPHPENPLPVDLRPRASGDETGFQAEIDASPGWEACYRRWVRTWDSPSPEVLTIRDEWELAQGTGVEFYWNTRLPVEITGARLAIFGKRGRVEIEIPQACLVRIDVLPLLEGDFQRRIAFAKAGLTGSLEIRARLILAGENA